MYQPCLNHFIFQSECEFRSEMAGKILSWFYLKLISIIRQINHLKWCVLDKVSLNIKRTFAGKSRCSYPTCNETRNVHRISDHNRQIIAVQSKVYIPINATACPNHANFVQWGDVSSLIDHPRLEFTKAYVEDMFNLLTNGALISDAPAESRKSLLFFVWSLWK